MNGMKKILFLNCLFSLSFYSCALRDYLAPKGTLDSEKTFYGQMISDGKTYGWFNVPAKLIKTTDHLAIYIQTKFESGYNGEKDISLYGLNKMAQDFDYYYDSMTNIYGEHTDIDANGKIIILLMKINKNVNGSQVLGYFNPNDMHGYNEGEILYMDLESANNNTDKLIGTLIHEFQHLINYSYVASGKRRAMSSWLNESLSESTSILFNKTTAKSRIDEFNGINYYCFYTWEIPINISNNGKNNSLVNYPSASVFMHWLYNTNGNKSDIFKKIAQSTENTDYNKVLTAAKGISGLNSISSWEDLLLTWMDDIVSNGLTLDGKKATNNLSSTGTVKLFPGAMIVVNSFSNSTDSNIVTRTNGNNGSQKIIVLNKDTTLGTYTSSKTVSVNSSVDLAAENGDKQNIIENKKEETQIINILLDENGNIQKY